MLLLILAAGFFFSCAKPIPPELNQASRVISGMLRPSYLSDSMFYAAYPEGKPSDFVSYIFSEIGSAEWPPSDKWADELARQQMRASGQTVVPSGVYFSPHEPDVNQGMQVVIRADDVKNLVLIDGYVSPQEPPLFSRRIPLVKVEPSPLAVLSYQSNIELGASPSSP